MAGIIYADEVYSSSAYFSNYGYPTVTVIDTNTDSVLDIIDVAGESPFGVAINPAGTRVYVTDPFDDLVSVIDTSDNSVIATITSNSWPHGVAVSPDGSRVYVANSIGNTLAVINAHTNQIITTIGVGSEPLGVAVNPAGSYVYVTNPQSNNLSIIDTSSDTVIATLAVGSLPQGVAVNPFGTKVYIANAGSNTVSVIDTTNITLIDNISVGSWPRGVAVDPSGSRIYVTNSEGNTVSVIDGASHSVIATIAVGSHPTGIAVTPDGTRVYVANFEGSSASVIDTATNSLLDTIDAGRNPMAFGQFIGGKGGSSFELNPESSSGSIGSVQCIEGTFTDKDNYPIAGEPVEFKLAIPTDDNGKSRFCYTNDSARIDVISASVGVHKLQASASWIAPSFSVNDVTQKEGNMGKSLFTFFISLNYPSNAIASINYFTDGTGTATSGVDYKAVNQTHMTFKPGEIKKEVSISVRGDRSMEQDETFFVSLGNAVGATIGDGQGQGTIINDDR